MSLSDTDISLADTAAPTRVSKIHKIITNRVPVALFGLKLGQNESYGLQEPFKTLPALREPVFGPKYEKTTSKKM